MSAAATPNDVMAVASRWVVSSVAVQFGKAVLLFGSQIALARLLSPTDFGVVAMCAPIFGVFALFNDLGLSQAVIQRPDLTEDDSNNVFWINLALGCVLALMLLLLAPAVAGFYNDHRVAGVLATLSVLIIVNSLSFQQVALMHRRMEPLPILLIDIAPVLANLIASIFAALLDYGYWAIVIGQLAHTLTAGVLAWTLSPFRPAWPRALGQAMPLMKFGAHLTGLSIASFAATSLSPLLIGRIFGALEVGLFDRGYKLVNMSFIQFLTPLSRIAETSLARLSSDPSRYRKAHLQFSEALILFLTPGLICLAFMSDDAVQVLYGKQWVAASAIVSWFAVASLLAPAGAAASWLFVSQGRTREMLRCGLIGQLLSVVSLAFGLPWGPTGVAISAAIFSVPIQAVMMWGATREGPVSMAHFAGMLLPIALSTIVSAALVYGLSLQLRPLSLHPLLVLGFGLLAAYAGAALALCATRPGRRIIHDARRAAQMLTQNRVAA
ncbi:lipopolysaccharide biosynthesis protein [Bradyrhizobium sp.]|uniref:lipopolysaccharide biosynthesis protein n=1 Tax=Bradyrhizobium sp. TaxID=376 RepID=UPI002D638F76|nr:lipopolysaccharide biosynthesis protein [Bradyrhizobium sp.]HZR73601.1 lipopolysaccharide biosynthesis protein [Bradyrhizobium sp.]